jgi:acetyl-CoA carboxylase beta subunit
MGSTSEVKRKWMSNSDQEKKSATSKTYYCPHCQKPLMKGDVKRFNMACPNCHKSIDAKGDELLNQRAADISG